MKKKFELLEKKIAEAKQGGEKRGSLRNTKRKADRSRAFAFY